MPPKEVIEKPEPKTDYSEIEEEGANGEEIDEEGN